MSRRTTEGYLNHPRRIVLNSTIPNRSLRSHSPTRDWKGFWRLSLVTCLVVDPATSESEKISIEEIALESTLTIEIDEIRHRSRYLIRTCVRTARSVITHSP